MFEDSLFDSGGDLRKRKTWPKLVSFVIEVGAISLLVLAPLIYIQGLPKQQIVDTLRLPSPPAGRVPAQVVHEPPRAARDSRELDDKLLREPSRIPLKTQMVREEPSVGGPPSLDGLVEGGTSDEVPNAVITEIARSVPPTVVKPATPQKLRVSSGVAAGMLIYQTETDLSATRGPGANTGHGCATSGDREGRHGSRLTRDQRTSFAGAGRDRSCDAVEISSLPAEQ